MKSRLIQLAVQEFVGKKGGWGSVFSGNFHLRGDEPFSIKSILKGINPFLNHRSSKLTVHNALRVSDETGCERLQVFEPLCQLQVRVENPTSGRLPSHMAPVPNLNCGGHCLSALPLSDEERAALMPLLTRSRAVFFQLPRREAVYVSKNECKCEVPSNRLVLLPKAKG